MNHPMFKPPFQVLHVVITALQLVVLLLVFIKTTGFFNGQ